MFGFYKQKWVVIMQEITITEEQLEEIKKKELYILKEFDRVCKNNNLKYSLIYGTLLGAVRHGGFIPWDDDVDVCMLREDYEKFRKVAPKMLSKDFFYQSHETDREYFQLFDKIRLNDTVFKEKYYAQYHMHHGVYIDIFPCDKIPNNTFIRKVQLFLYQFYRVGVMTRFLDTEQRKGVKKILSKILSKFYSNFSMEHLYTNAEKIAKKYNETQTDNVFIFADTITCNSTIDYRSMNNPKTIQFEKNEFYCLDNYEQYLKNQYGDYMSLPPEDERVPKHELIELKL